MYGESDGDLDPAICDVRRGFPWPGYGNDAWSEAARRGGVDLMKRQRRASAADEYRAGQGGQGGQGHVGVSALLCDAVKQAISCCVNLLPTALHCTALHCLRFLSA